MPSMKLIRLAVPFVLALAFVAGASAPAMGQTWTLYPTGIEPNASGKVTLKSAFNPGHHVVYPVVVQVACKGLKPNTRYLAAVMYGPKPGYYSWSTSAFVTNGNGAGHTVLTLAGTWWPVRFDVSGPGGLVLTWPR